MAEREIKLLKVPRFLIAMKCKKPYLSFTNVMRIIKAGIMKGIGMLLVLVVFETYVCSFSCAVGASSCCSEPVTEQGCSRKSCCSKNETTGKNEDGCQKEHFAFLKTIGQYISDNSPTLVKDLTDLLVILTPKLPIQPFSVQKLLVDYNCYHPPQAMDEVCILTQNFRI